MRLAIKRLSHGVGLPLPAYATAGSAGLDLPLGEDVTLAPGARALVPTGFALAIPAGFEGQVRPRSGLAVRLGLTVLNAPGTLDSDYRGEVKVPLINLGQDSLTLTRGMRIAQLVIAPAPQVNILEVSELEATDRGAGGFGSTGV